MQDVLYEVFETDADLIEGKLVHQGFSRDIAESKMFRVFYLCAGQKDYMLKNHNTQDLISCCFTDATIASRGECQS
jgi:hypothetical protein